MSLSLPPPPPLGAQPFQVYTRRTHHSTTLCEPTAAEHHRHRHRHLKYVQNVGRNVSPPPPPTGGRPAGDARTVCLSNCPNIIIVKRARTISAVTVATTQCRRNFAFAAAAGASIRTFRYECTQRNHHHHPLTASRPTLYSIDRH